MRSLSYPSPSLLPRGVEPTRRKGSTPLGLAKLQNKNEQQETKGRKHNVPQPQMSLLSSLEGDSSL